MGADGLEWFTSTQAAAFLGIGESTLRLWRESGRFVPDRQKRGVNLYSRRQLEERLASFPGELAARAFQCFERGRSAVETVIELRADPTLIHSLHASWIKMTEAWIVAGPPGGRRRWEAIYDIGTITPVKLRRALELCCSSPELREKLLAESA